MSHLITHLTPVTSHELLIATCKRLREQGHNVTGPHFVTGHRSRDGATLDGYAVRLPGWTKDVVYTCDESKRVDADNWSPFFDERQIDAATGERISGTGGVHPEVLAGRKQPGENGRWGDIKELNRLHREYKVMAHEEVAVERGDYMTRTDNADGSIELEIQVAE